MSEEEKNEKFKIIFEKALTKLAENPDEFFENDKLQKNYNDLLKEKIKYKKEIERLKEELKQAKEIALNDHKYASEMEDKYIEANNIINELDKWLEVNLTNLEKEETSNIYNEGLKQGMLSNGRLIKDKLQELKGSSNNE